MLNKAERDRIYTSVPLDKIPWNIETPPDALVDLVKSEKVKPCATIDLGCGLGNYAVYLASIGFDVTGVDISPTAIKFAKDNAKRKGVKCNFIVANILTGLAGIGRTFDFAYDWEVLHSIFPEKRKKYVQNVHGILTPERKVSLCLL